MKTIIKDKTFDEERALYNLRGAEISNCNFAGPADGESALKECSDISIDGCTFELRYPLWHVTNFTLGNFKMTETARAALWYSKNGKIYSGQMGGIKALRECEDITIENCDIVSPEFGWRSRNVTLENCTAQSEYFFFEGKNLTLKNVEFKGKYSFQYVENSEISDSVLNTKDAFWHCKNLTVKNSVLNGEYLGWYSDGLTLENCLISGTQPLCYCKNLKLINCRTQGCDLAFEYSEAEASIIGRIDSIKNLKSGKVIADDVGEVINENPAALCNGEIIIRKNR